MWRKTEVISVNKRRSFIFGVAGIITFLATIIIFVITDHGNNMSTYLGLAFLIYSEIILFGGFVTIEHLVSKGAQIVIRTGCGGIITIYSILVFFCSIVYMVMNTNAVVTFLIVQIIAAAAAIIGVLILAASSHTIKKNDADTTSSILALSDMISTLEIMKGNRKYGKKIGKLAEDLYFTDISSLVSVDKEIATYISKMEMSLAQDEYAIEVEGYIEKVIELIRIRKIQLREKKMGGM